MLAKRIIPTILNKRGQMVKGKHFAADRVVGNVLQAAKVYAMRSVDELMILDVTATEDNREPDYEMVKKLSEGCFSPLTVGGGIKTVFHVEQLLRAGADKICIGAGAYDCRLLEKLSGQFGASTIVVSLDVNHSKTMVNLIDAQIMAQLLKKRGAGEILLQNIERDGTLEGYDIRLIKAVSKSVDIPVIASGGCSGYEDMYNAIQAGASAVAVGALFQFTDCTPGGAAQYLSDHGVEVRL